MIYEILYIIITIFFIWFSWFIYNLPKKISDYILENQKAEFQKDINRDTRLHEERVKLVTEFLLYMNNIVSEKKDLSNLKNQKEINKKMTDFGIRLILFASDDTICKYEDFRECAYSKKNILKVYGEFVIAIRKDLGYLNTKLKPEDYLKLILKESKEEIKRVINN